MAVDVTRRKFVAGSAAVGTGLALGGPMSALAKTSARGRKPPRVVGYGDLQPTPEEDSGEIFLELPRGFRYRVINREGQTMSDGNPTPGIFDGTGSYPGPHGTVILIRNHENRSRPLEITVDVPAGMRYDPDENVRGGNTKLVVDRGTRRVVESFAVLGGTHTNCAGGVTPWNTWITCEEIFTYGAGESGPGDGVPHGYIFEVPADADGPVDAVPVRQAGRFVHEAVAWLDGALYETEDQGSAAFYRFVPRRRPREMGDLASFGGTLQALRVVGKANANMDEDVLPGGSVRVEWVAIEEPNPTSDTVRQEAQAKGAAIFNRTEGIWSSDRSVYFDCTSGGRLEPQGAGQLWKYTPRGRDGGELELVFESPGADVLDAPDNLVLVPGTGDVWLQEDGGGGDQFVRGVTRRGEIYDFAKTVINDTEFCGGCFSPDGRTFFVSQQGDRVAQPAPNANAALTYAIWGPFDNKDDRRRD